MKVLIIGAGVAGLGIGWRLLQRGAQVTVLERTQPASAATWAAAGMIAPVGESVHGAETEFGRKSSALWPGFASELEGASGLEIDYRKNGALFIAPDEASAHILGERAIEEESLELLTPPQALEKEPLLTPVISGAAWCADEAQVDNRALGQALTRAFTGAGGNLQLNEPAVRFENDGEKIHGVRSPFKFYEADAYLIAAGAWSGQFEGLHPQILPPVVPVKGEMIALEAPANARIPEHVIRGIEVYLVPRGRRLFVGATVSQSGFDTSVTDKAKRWLQSHATTLLPSLADWQVDEHWAGLRPGSPDELPILGPTKISNLFAATGQYRNGILFAPALAEVMLQTILDGKLPAEYAAFDARRFA
ncbi:MAG TPA: glycine oxidase ThiO [Rhizomicrobium sp.]|nr:glycine oxidase ThiO [Rhizomicrobium sp.]